MYSVGRLECDLTTRVFSGRGDRAGWSSDTEVRPLRLRTSDPGLSAAGDTVLALGTQRRGSERSAPKHKHRGEDHRGACLISYVVSSNELSERHCERWLAGPTSEPCSACEHRVGGSPATCAYQLAFVRPGTSPARPRSRSAILEKPNLR